MKNNKINIIDILVVALIIIVVIGVSYRLFGSKSKPFKNEVKFNYQIKVENVRQQTIDELQNKGEVFTSKNNIKTGEIVDVQVEPFLKKTQTENGEWKNLEVPEKYTAYITIECNGTINDSGFYDGEKVEIGAGREYNICTKTVSTTGMIMKVWQ